MGEKTIDGGGDDPHAVGVQAVPCEPAMGEDLDVGGLDVGAKEVPGLAYTVIGLVDADVDSPHDPDAGVAQGGGQAGGLGVVQDHDVARRHERSQLAPGALGDRLIRGAGRVVEGLPVAARAVEAVVQALGDLEERGVAAQHEPARVDARTARVGQQRAQHLGHAATDGRRVHAPHRAAGHQRARALGQGQQLVHAGLVEDRAEALEAERSDGDGRERVGAHGSNDATGGPDPIQPQSTAGGVRLSADARAAECGDDDPMSVTAPKLPPAFDAQCA